MWSVKSSLQAGYCKYFSTLKPVVVAIRCFGIVAILVQSRFCRIVRSSVVLYHVSECDLCSVPGLLVEVLCWGAFLVAEYRCKVILLWYIAVATFIWPTSPISTSCCVSYLPLDRFD